MPIIKIILFFFLGFSVFSVFSQQPEKGSTSITQNFNAELKDTNYMEMEVDQLPSFPKLNQYLSSKIIYPASSIENEEEGKVILQFVVESDGTINHIKIAQSSGYAALDNEAIRVLSQMPKWNPGSKNGKPVRTYFRLPVSFVLQ